MNMLPLSTMSEERTQNQYLADVTQENVERQRRNADVFDPNAPGIRDNWYATQVGNHERLFPFSDNLTTLVFIVVSDVSEGQRKRDSQVPFLSRELMSLLALLKQQEQCLWNCSVRRKAQ